MIWLFIAVYVIGVIVTPILFLLFDDTAGEMGNFEMLLIGLMSLIWPAYAVLLIVGLLPWLLAKTVFKVAATLKEATP